LPIISNKIIAATTIKILISIPKYNQSTIRLEPYSKKIDPIAKDPITRLTKCNAPHRKNNFSILSVLENLRYNIIKTKDIKIDIKGPAAKIVKAESEYQNF
jgi:ABC-type branched-subunit amino acid transport system ATPase component